MAKKRMFDYEVIAEQYNMDKRHLMKYCLIYLKSFLEMN